MFTRVVKLTAKPGKTNELSSAVSGKVLSILKKQQGFQDEIILVSNTDSKQVLVLSFWNSREDAERYHREQFSLIAGMLRPLCEGDPVVSTFDVNTSTVHHINLRKAA
jgi:heme-degrading monooxygenase HmoA